LRRRDVRVEIVAHQTKPLAFGEQHHQPTDRRGKRRCIEPLGVREQGDELGVALQKLEQRTKNFPQPLQRPPAASGDRGQRRFELAHASLQDGLKQAALGVEVVEHELLVDPCSGSDSLDSGTCKPPFGELLGSGGAYSQCPVIAEFTWH